MKDFEKLLNRNDEAPKSPTNSLWPQIDDNDHQSIFLYHLLQQQLPPLSLAEEKEIIDALIDHPDRDHLTFDQAERFAKDKAMKFGKNSR